MVVLDAQLIGRFDVWHGATEIRLLDISLLPEFRGAGLGRQLLQGLLDEAQRRACQLTLHVQSDSCAKAWYRSLGFQDVNDDGIHTLMSKPHPAAFGAIYQPGSQDNQDGRTLPR